MEQAPPSASLTDAATEPETSADAAGTRACALEQEAQSPSDDELVAAYADGEIRAFELLYARHKGPLFRFFARQLDTADANDAFQETWSKLLPALDNYQPDGRFAGFLFTIATNVLNDVYRKQMRSGMSNAQETDVDTLESEEQTVEQIERDQLRQHLYAELKRLPVAQRSAWLLQHEGGLSLKEIAATTDSTLEGVKSRLRYANEKLKAGLQRYVRS